MADEQSPEAEYVRPTEDIRLEEDEHDGQGEGDDDLGVDDRNLVDAFQDFAATPLGIERADGAAGAKDGGKGGGDEGDEQGIA